MSGFLIACIVFVVLVVFHVTIYVLDRRKTQQRDKNGVNDYSIPRIDSMSTEDASQNANAILKKYGIPRQGELPNGVLSHVETSIADVLSRYELLTYDSLTNQIEVMADDLIKNTHLHPALGKVMRIGTWGSGEIVFVVFNQHDPQVYIEEGEGEFQAIAPTVYHYIIKAKQESDWADERLAE